MTADDLRTFEARLCYLLASLACLKYLLFH